MAIESAFMPNSCFLSQSFGKHKKQRMMRPLFHRISKDKLHCCFASQNVVHDSPQRNSANYQPSLWSYDFLQSLNNDYEDKSYEDRARRLLEDVREIIKDENTEIWTKLELIDDIQRLGLGYHFDKEIKEALNTFFSFQTRFNNAIITLHEAALSFRLLRNHGFDVSPDMFKTFKDQKGNFKECISQDVKGMLSLYEATFMGCEGEDILEEARDFTCKHLKQIKQEISITGTLLEQVNHALELPIHRRTQRLEARWYIEAYGKRKDANKVLLEAAKLDFNLVQSVLQRDLQEMSRWWKRLGLAPKLSFSRDRLMECFFWSVGMVFEPQHSELRKALTKVTCFITTIDDVYDVYGTLDELQLFTAAVEKWDINAINVLPEYMKVCFLALYNTVNEMAYDTLKERGQHVLPYLTKAWADMLKAFLVEAEWSNDKHIPTFKDYLRNAWVSVSGVLILVHAYFYVNPNMTNEALQSLDNHHDLLRWPSTIFRLCNDLATSKVELERGEGASSIVCYMRENGVNEEHSYGEIMGFVDEAWKKMNEEGRNIYMSESVIV